MNVKLIKKLFLALFFWGLSFQVCFGMVSKDVIVKFLNDTRNNSLAANENAQRVNSRFLRGEMRSYEESLIFDTITNHKAYSEEEVLKAYVKVIAIDLFIRCNTQQPTTPPSLFQGIAQKFQTGDHELNQSLDYIENFFRLEYGSILHAIAAQEWYKGWSCYAEIVIAHNIITNKPNIIPNANGNSPIHTAFNWTTPKCRYHSYYNPRCDHITPDCTLYPFARRERNRNSFENIDVYTIKLLLENATPEELSIKNRERKTALELLIEKGKPYQVQLLIEIFLAKGINPNEPFSNGTTPLESIARQLSFKYAGSQEEANKNESLFKIIEMLLAAGANPNQICTEEGKTPWIIFLEKAQSEITTCMPGEKAKQVFKKFIIHGANPNAEFKDYREKVLKPINLFDSTYYGALQEANNELKQFLLANGATPETN